MAKLEVIRPKIYQDVDGVLLPFGQSPFEMMALNGLESYAPEVVQRIGNTCLELVWCTSWSESELNLLTEQMDALRNSRQLPLERPRGIAQKLDAIIDDQEQNPGPFVWADDAITARERDEIEGRFAARAHLLVQPDRKVGIDEAELVSIEEFARTFEDMAVVEK